MALTKTSGSLVLALVCVVAATVVASATAPRPAPAGKPKVLVCHWSDTDSSWTRLSIGAPALAAHLRNHDDAVPGGTTSKTATELDTDCQQVVTLLTCPCWNTYTEEQLAAALNAENASAPVCQIADPGLTSANGGNGGGVPPLALAENGTSTDCLLRLTGSDSGLLQITQLQANACVAELSSVIPQIEWCAPHK